MKLVNTSLNEFERGKNPKGILKLGGLDIEAYYKKRKEDYNQNVDEASQEYQMAVQSLNMYHVDEVREYLGKNLIGKTITARVRELRKLINQVEPAEYNNRPSIFGEHTFTVQAIHYDDVSDTAILADMDNNLYSFNLWQKIYID